MARADYSANVGNLSQGNFGAGPASLAAGDALTDAQWQSNWGGMDRNGIVFRRSEIKFADILDGTSSTYMAGEGYLNPDFYEYGSPLPPSVIGSGTGDDQNMYVGFDRDTLRLSHRDTPGNFRPAHDKPGLDLSFSWGSITPAALIWCSPTLRFVRSSTQSPRKFIMNSAAGKTAIRSAPAASDG